MITECPKGINKSSPKSIRNDTCGGDLYCRSCGVEFESPQQPKKQTNFERITASVEAFMKFLYIFKDADESCEFCAFKECGVNPCIDGIKQWLEQEVEEWKKHM